MGLGCLGSHDLPDVDRCHTESYRLAQADTFLDLWGPGHSYYVESTRHDGPSDHEALRNQGNWAGPHEGAVVAHGGQSTGDASSHLQALLGRHCCPGICGGRVGGSLVSKSWTVLC